MSTKNTNNNRSNDARPLSQESNPKTDVNPQIFQRDVDSIKPRVNPQLLQEGLRTKRSSE